MKTKRFLMTSLLVMGMIIARAANGYPPELVLVSQPVLTYNANSVTVYYDIQNIGDYTYRGNIYLYMDPDNGYFYGMKYAKIRPGRIKRVSIEVPNYRLNPSWVYTMMPYYEMGDDLYSFTTFEYFEPVYFCWGGYHDEPWVVVTIGSKPRSYYRPGEYRYYYDGYRLMMPPPPPGGPAPHGMPLMNPAHHTYAYHHNHGGYPANYHPHEEIPGYNHYDPSAPTPPSNGSGATVHHGGSNTPGSSSYTSGSNGNSNSGGSNGSGATTRPTVTTRPSTNTGATTRPSSDTGSSGATTRPSGNSDSSGNSSNSGSSGATTRPTPTTTPTPAANPTPTPRPSSGTGTGVTTRPSTNSGSTGSSSDSGRPSSSGSVSRPSNNSSGTGTSSGSSGSSSGSGRSGSSNNRGSGSGSSSSSGSSSGSSRGGSTSPRR